MAKIYYSVVYRNWGADRASEAWFDDKEKAYDFANHDYRDNPVMHRVSRPKKITEYNELVDQTAFNLSNY